MQTHSKISRFHLQSDQATFLNALVTRYFKQHFICVSKKFTLKYLHQTVLVIKSLKVSLKEPQLQKCQIVTKGPLSGYISAPCIVTIVPFERDKSSLSMLRKFPKLLNCPIFVTKVLFFLDKSAHSYGSLSRARSFSLPLSFFSSHLVTALQNPPYPDNVA